MLAYRDRLAKTTKSPRRGGAEKGKAEPKPRLPVRCRASRPFGTIISAPRDLSVSGPRARLHGSPQSGGVTPAQARYFTSRGCDAIPILARLEPGFGG